jgi:hypothetical protein
MWQTVELKAGFIQQVLGGQVGGRQLDDVASDQELSYAEVKALATGDDRIVRKAALEADVARLRRQRSAHHEDQARLQRTVTRGLQRRATLERRQQRLEQVAAAVVDTRGDRFAATVDGTAYDPRGAAGTHLLALIDQALNVAAAGRGTDRAVAQLGGISWTLNCRATAASPAQLTIPEVDIAVNVERDDLATIDGGRLMQRLEHTVAKLPDTLDDTRAAIGAVSGEVDAASTRLGHPFPHQHDLDTAESELAALNAELTDPGEPSPTPPSPTLAR